MADDDKRGIRIAGLGLAGATAAVVATAVAMAVTGVVAPAATLPTAAAAELPAFTGCDQLAQWYRDTALPLVTPYGLPGVGGPVVYGFAAGAGGVMNSAAGIAQGSLAPVPSSVEGAGADASKAVGNGSTGTNLQEAGVDEADVVKTDGRYVVGLDNDRLYVADTTGTPRVVGSVRLPARGQELLLDGDRALVVSGDGGGPVGLMAPGGPGGPVGGLRPQQWSPTVVLTVVDLSDRTSPAVVSREDVDGTYLSARLHDGVVRVVVGTSPTRLPFTQPVFPSVPGPATKPDEGGAGTPAPTYSPPSPAAIKAAEQQALEKNREVVRQASAQDWLPQRTVHDAAGAVVNRGPLLDCNDVRHPTQPAGLRTLSVLTFGLAGAEPFATGRPAAVTADGDLVYASADHLYVATSRWGAWRAPGKADRPTTQIHEFDTSDRSGTSYVASGSVDGFVYGRWAFSEQDGRLRVATTTGSPWRGMEGVAPSTESRVVVLERDGASLGAVGEVRGLGPGEMVRAVRWFGDLAAVVTYRQTDPLYLVDLSSPTAPALRGELKMPGYSAYLHPVGDGRLLGIGHDADAAGRVQQMQVALFDVSDPAHPTRTSVTRLGYGFSAVENESRAFTYLPDRHLAVLPAMWYPPEKFLPAPETPVDSGTTSSSVAGVAEPTVPGGGVAAVAVDGSRVVEAGRWLAGAGTWTDVQRVLPVGDRLVAVTGTSLVLLDPDGLRQLATVALPRT